MAARNLVTAFILILLLVVSISGQTGRSELTLTTEGFVPFTEDASLTTTESVDVLTDPPTDEVITYEVGIEDSTSTTQRPDITTEEEVLLATTLDATTVEVEENTTTAAPETTTLKPTEDPDVVPQEVRMFLLRYHNILSNRAV